MYLVVAIFFFGVLIAFHELGHMWVARRMGMRVERYSIGFGPVLWTARRGETEYVVSAFPLGGYVRIAGMATEDETEDDDPGSYANKPAWRRLLVIAAGPLANYLLAFLIGVPLLMYGLREPTLTLSEVSPGKPAAKAGLQPGDTVRAVGGTPVATFDAFRKVLVSKARAAAGTPVVLTVERGGAQLDLPLVPEQAGEGFIIGVSPRMRPAPGLSFASAVPTAVMNVGLETARTVTTLLDWIRGRQKVELSGPIGIIDVTMKQAKKGLAELVQTFWGLSIAVGFFNLLPLPALDGGRLMFLGYEVVTRRRVDRRVEGWIHTVGIVALLALILVVSYGDIMKRLGG